VQDGEPGSYAGVLIHILWRYNLLLFKHIGLKTLLDIVMLYEKCVSYIRRMSTSNVSL
jgi:hypothetical protein